MKTPHLSGVSYGYVYKAYVEVVSYSGTRTLLAQRGTNIANKTTLETYGCNSGYHQRGNEMK
jgi:hypothetical protein